jgi:hypothetical protein
MTVVQLQALLAELPAGTEVEVSCEGCCDDPIAEYSPAYLRRTCDYVVVPDERGVRRYQPVPGTERLEFVQGRLILAG